MEKQESLPAVEENIDENYELPESFRQEKLDKLVPMLIDLYGEDSPAEIYRLCNDFYQVKVSMTEIIRYINLVLKPLDQVDTEIHHKAIGI